MLDLFLIEIYKVLYLDLKNFELKFENKIISKNKKAIINFLGLCYTQYQKGFKSNIEIFEYIKGSHFFNIEYFNNKQLKEYHNFFSKRNQYDYKFYKKFIISENDYFNLNDLDKSLFINFKISYKNLQNLSNKNINLIEDRTIYLDKVIKFFKNF